MRDTPITDEELRAGRDYLVGVFPLRFETPGAVVGALAGIVVHELPDDELATYRPRIEAVTVDDVAAAAAARLAPERAAIVLVGDVDAFGRDLEAAEFGRIVIERDEVPPTAGPAEEPEDEIGPIDEGPGGPAEGAEEPGGGVDDPTESRQGFDREG
jgi:hypothetical protein